jgi:DNA-binding transcriptional MocR family regulator
MVLLNVNRESSTPIFRQIINQMVDLIDQDVLKKDTVLPPSREMAGKLGLDRSTVYRAYQELIAMGFIDSTPGSYSRVRGRPAVVTPERKSERSLIDWSAKSSDSGNSLYRYFEDFATERSMPIPPGTINLSPLSLDPRVYPVEDFRRCLNQVLVNEGAPLLSYGNDVGYLPLREYIAGRMKIHGVSIYADEILITNGAQQAIDLVLHLFSKPGARVAIETPTYANVIPSIRGHQMQILEIPMNSDGMNLDYLRQHLKTDPPDFVYTIPNFHNPTGITTSQKHRETLLHLCEDYQIPIVEDGFEEELKYFGKVVLPIKSMDKNQIVIYLGSFSKILFPGIRVGWIAADKECIRRLTAVKRFNDLTSSTLIQAALNVFCRQGYYDLHIKRMYRIFRKRMRTALDAMEKNFPEGVIWTKPDGGYTIWVRLQKDFDTEEAFYRLLLKNRVLVSPGRYYFYSKNPQKYFRISISSLSDDEIEEGIIRLGRVLTELRRASG